MTDKELDSMVCSLNVLCTQEDEETLDAIRIICKLIAERKPQVQLETGFGDNKTTSRGSERSQFFWLSVNNLQVVFWEVFLVGSWDESWRWTVNQTHTTTFQFAKVIIKELGIDYKVTELPEPPVIHKFLTHQSKDGRYGLFTIGAAHKEPLARYDDVEIALTACRELGEQAHFVRELVQEWKKLKQ